MAGWNVVCFHLGILPKHRFMTQLLTDIHRPDAFTQPRERREKRSGSTRTVLRGVCVGGIEGQTVLCFPRLWDANSSSYPRETE